MAKRFRSTNFSKHDIQVLKEILSHYDIVHNKSKTLAVEWAKKEAWKKITVQFNAHENVNKRDVNQLKNAWRKLKASASTNRNELLKPRIMIDNRSQTEAFCSDLCGPVLDVASTAEAIDLEPSMCIKPEPTTLLGLPEIMDNDQIAHLTADGDNESKASSPFSPDHVLLQASNNNRSSDTLHDRQLEMMEAEHRVKMRVLEADLANKLLEREQRLKEHEATLRNLDAAYEKLRNGDMNACSFIS